MRKLSNLMWMVYKYNYAYIQKQKNCKVNIIFVVILYWCWLYPLSICEYILIHDLCVVVFLVCLILCLSFCLLLMWCNIMYIYMWPNVSSGECVNVYIHVCLITCMRVHFYIFLLHLKMCKDFSRPIAMHSLYLSVWNRLLA